MSFTKPSLPKGTRDFGPDRMMKRNYIFDHIRSVFSRYGFLPLETPSMEMLSVLTGKYGEEGDQLIFKILNTGDFKDSISGEEKNSKELANKIASKGLRYDLTVPLARFVVSNRGDLTLPFRRYQIQPVWRGDRPQKGRYREFVQCDVDIIGSESLVSEAELIMMTTEIMELLGIRDHSIKVNSRKILAGINQVAGLPGRETELFVAIDKLDKIGKEGVIQELRQKGWDSKIELLEGFFLSRSLDEHMTFLKDRFKASQIGSEGLEDISGIMTFLQQMDGKKEVKLEFDPMLARGLSYYTGAIFEVKANNVQIGSISGGGRYDDLTGAFGVPGIPAVGISYGIDRIYDVMEELNLFPDEEMSSTRVLVAPFDSESIPFGLQVVHQLRTAGVNSEIYPEAVKMKKKLTYANRKAIPYVILIGSNEVETGELALKNMETGEQKSLSIQQILDIMA